MGLAKSHNVHLSQECVLTYSESSSFWQELAYDSTGGNPTMFFSDTSGGLRNLIFLPYLTDDMQAEETNQSDLSGILEQIRTTFGFNHSELAVVCGLSRKALYDWKKGSRPRKKSIERITQLLRAALDWRRSGFPEPGPTILHLPVVQDLSLYDLLQAEPLDLEAIHFAGARMAMRENADQRNNMSEPFA